MRFTDLALLTLKTFRRSPSLKYSIAFAALSLAYLAVFGSPRLCELFTLLTTVFSLSLCAADRRVSTSLVRGLRVCGARRAVARASIYMAAALRALATCLPPAVACSTICGSTTSALIVVAPLLASLLYEECSVVRRG